MTTRYLVPIIRKIEGWERRVVAVPAGNRREAAATLRHDLETDEAQFVLTTGSPGDIAIDRADTWAVDTEALIEMFQQDAEGER